MNRFRDRSIGWLAVVMATAALSACNEQVKTEKPTVSDQPVARTPAPDQDLPTLAELQPAISPFAIPSREATLVTRTLTVQKMIYPRDDGRVDLALDALEPVELPEDKAALWKANGLHLARLPAERLALWTANLPEPLALSGINILPGLEYGRVSLIGRASSRTIVHLPGEDDATRIERLVGGQYELLLKLTRRVESPEQIMIDVVPNHVSPRDRIRPAAEAGEPIGTSFDNLRILTAAPDKECWLIWSDTQQRAADATTALQEGEHDLSAPLLGRTMMTALRGGRPVRLVLVVLVK